MTQGFTGAGSAGGVTSINKTGSTPLTGAVTLTQGTNITLTQSGNDITICGTGGGGGGSPGGTTNSIQYNVCGGTFGGDNYFQYDPAYYAMRVGYDDGSGTFNNTGQGNIIQYSTISGASVYATGNANHANVSVCASSVTMCGTANIAYGYLTTGGTLAANGCGTLVGGYISACGAIYSGAVYGGQAFGRADYSGYITIANGNGSLAHGDANSSGFIQADNSSHAHGYVANCGYIQGGGTGTHVHGYADCGGYMYAGATGSHVWGQAVGSSTYISTCGYGGNWAGGYAADGGYISACGFAAGAFGSASCGGSIISSGSGGWASGTATNYGLINNGGYGGITSGWVGNSGAQISNTGYGNIVTGYNNGTNLITTGGNGNLVIGETGYNTQIASCGSGSIVHGKGSSCGSGIILGLSDGVLAGGFANYGDIRSEGTGSFVQGYADCYNLSTACGTGFALGRPVNGAVTTSGDRAWAFGDNINASGNDTTAWGSGFTNSEGNSFQIGYGTSRFKVNADNQLVQAGLSSGHIAKIGGKIDGAYADNGNSTTTETDLYSYTLPAQALNNNGEGLTAFYSVNILGSATATTTLRVYFAGTAYFDSGALSLAANGNWQIWVELVRTSSSTARISVTLQSPGAALAVYTAEADITGLDFTTTNVFKLTGQRGGVGAASDDIVFKHGKVHWEAA